MLDKIVEILKKNFSEIDFSISKDPESEEYSGHNLNSESVNIKYRKAKITPKKIGQFVTFWKRNSDGETIPFSINDNFDFYIVATEELDSQGFFIFPKLILSQNGIITHDLNEGKRGFRVYPPWALVNNKQAEKSKLWQNKYFVDFNNPLYLTQVSEILDKFK